MSTRLPLTLLATSSLIFSAAFIGCGEDGADTTTTSSGDGGGTTVGSGGAGAGGEAGVGGGGDGGSGGTPMNMTRATISGDITWNVTFDAEAQSNGATDCSYTRHYEGVQDDSAPWLCPQCEMIFRADVQLTSGLNDCFAQITMGMPAPQEWIGYGNGVWYRSSNGLMSEQGSVMVADDSATTSHGVADLEAQVGGLFSFGIDGQFTMAEEAGDPAHGFRAAASYSCGWPKADPPAYTGDYTLAIGQTVPDGLFKDHCDEVVRLHDFAGSYLMIDMSAMDCPPCQAMAGQEEQFVADMAAQGIEVHVITLLAPSLQNVYGETTNTMLNNWISSYQLTSPILADRAWGLSMFLPFFDGGGSYPSWVLVDPDLNVFEAGQGFGGFGDIETAILADINGN